jgi:23S rRNA pseudouridine1911/1915/1917 synthase
MRVGPELAGQRVDHAVAGALPGVTIHGARRMIAAGRVRVDGRRVRKGDRLQAGQLLDLDEEAAAPEASRVRPEPERPIAILHVDDALVAIDKPAGWPSHPLAPGELGTAANALVARFPECALASPDVREAGLAHRLDTETSGVLLAARSRDAWNALRSALGDPSCEKTYLAEVAGDPPDTGVAEGAIGRSGRRTGRVRIDGGRRPLPARTEWQVLERRDGGALVRARLHRGRPHQVRAHLASAGFPILGDPTYADPAGRALAAARGVAGMRLHAASVGFRHPTTGAPTLIEAPPPAWAMIKA